MSKGRKCLICGTKYEYCPNCDAYDKHPRWMFLYHDKNCKDIGCILNDYKAGTKTAKDAKYALSKTDLTNRDLFDPAFKAMIDEIMDSEAVQDKIVNENSESKFSSKKSYKK